MTGHSCTFLVLLFGTTPQSYYFWHVRSSFRKIIFMVYFEMFETFLFQFLSAVWFLQIWIYYTSFISTSLAVSNVMHMDWFSSFAKKHLFPANSFKNPLCSRICPSLFLQFVNILWSTLTIVTEPNVTLNCQ